MFEPSYMFIVNRCIVCLYLLISIWILYIDTPMCCLFGHDLLLGVPQFRDLIISLLSLTTGNVQLVVSSETLFHVPRVKEPLCKAYRKRYLYFIL